MTSSHFGIETVREAVRKRVAATSLRATADEIGMSFSGLRSFLTGTTPHRATRTKLIEWYAQPRDRDRGLSNSDRAAAVDLLVRYVRDGGSPGARARRLRTILDTLTRSSRLDDGEE